MIKKHPSLPVMVSDDGLVSIIYKRKISSQKYYQKKKALKGLRK